MDMEARAHSEHPEALRLWLRLLTCTDVPVDIADDLVHLSEGDADHRLSLTTARAGRIGS